MNVNLSPVNEVLTRSPFLGTSALALDHAHIELIFCVLCFVFYMMFMCAPMDPVLLPFFVILCLHILLFNCQSLLLFSHVLIIANADWNSVHNSFFILCWLIFGFV